MSGIFQSAILKPVSGRGWDFGTRVRGRVDGRLHSLCVVLGLAARDTGKLFELLSETRALWMSMLLTLVVPAACVHEVVNTPPPPFFFLSLSHTHTHKSLFFESFSSLSRIVVCLRLFDHVDVMAGWQTQKSRILAKTKSIRYESSTRLTTVARWPDTAGRAKCSPKRTWLMRRAPAHWCKLISVQTDMNGNGVATF